MARLIGGLAAGLVAAFALIFLIEMIGHAFYPLPSDLVLVDPEQAARVIVGIPLAANLLVMLAWFVGALAGALAARRISGRDWAGWAVASLVAVAGIANILMIPHPVWMQIAAVAAPLFGGLIAHHLPAGARKRSGDASA